MDWINYHHLLYFWVVAREGSVTRASELLHLAQPTISGQLKKLEDSLGEKLYDRVGRELVLTETGKTVFKYASEIFTLGQELQDVLKGQPSARLNKFTVGIPDVMPKLIAYRLIEPVMKQFRDEIHFVCREGDQNDLLAQLATHDLDVVLSDAPAGSMVRVKAFNHLLGECGVGIFGSQELADQFKKNFPHSLANAAFFLPSEQTALRNSFDRWRMEQELPVRILGEFDDTALMKVFAEYEQGLTVAPLAIGQDLDTQYGLKLLGEIPGAQEQFYAISIERKLKHPAVRAMSEAAKTSVFL